jgi:hypothetical protein
MRKPPNASKCDDPTSGAVKCPMIEPIASNGSIIQALQCMKMKKKKKKKEKKKKEKKKKEKKKRSSKFFQEVLVDVHTS